MNKIIQKITSRKFITAMLGIVTGVAVLFGVDEGVITTVAGAVMATASAVSYILAEGRIDAERIKNAAEQIQEAKDAVGGAK